MTASRLAGLLASLLFLPVPSAMADDESPWRLGVAVGYGERTNPLAMGGDIPIIADLDIAWFGKRFYFDNGDLGFTVADLDRVTISLVARVNSDRVFFAGANNSFIQFFDRNQAEVVPLRITVPDRPYAVEAGVELLTDGRWGRLQTSFHHDISNTHNGYDIDADYSVGRRFGRWYFEPSVGASYKSSELNNYYWGVDAGEANPILPASVVGDGINLRGSIRSGYYLSPRLAIVMSLQYERLNDEAVSSVIVVEDHVVGYFAGLAMRW